jgi:hypothetical protein
MKNKSINLHISEQSENLDLADNTCLPSYTFVNTDTKLRDLKVKKELLDYTLIVRKLSSP